MIMRWTFKRIALTLLLVLLFLLLHNYPEEINREKVISDERKITIYLIDENDFVAMSTISDDSEEIIDRVRNIIKMLTIGENKEIKDGFRAVIPEGTKLLDEDFKDGLIKLNFSKKFLDVSEDDEEKMIEAIIYSLMEIKEIKKIMIFVEGERLLKLPNSGKRLDLYLDKSFGINKVIDINGIKNTQMTTIYYLAKNKDYYYVPVSFISNSNDDKISIIIKNLKMNSLNNSNLLSHLNYQVELMNYEIKDERIELNFNSVLMNSLSDGKLREEVKYAIAYSIRDSLLIEDVVFLIDSEYFDEMNFRN